MNNPFFKNMLVYRISRDFTINQEELEQQLAGYVGTKHCITCANGTDALSLVLMVVVTLAYIACARWLKMERT